MSAHRATPVPALTVQPVHFTSDHAAWKAFYTGLGLQRTAADDPFFTVLAADSGQLLLAEVPAGSTLDGVRLVEFTVPDLDAHAAALEDAGVPVDRVELAHRDSLSIDLPQGRVHICQSAITAGSAPFDPAHLNLGALLYAPASMVTPGAHALAPYGMTPRIASDTGGWTDLMGNGLFAFHEGPLRTVENDAPNQPVVNLLGETADISRLAQELEGSGLSARIIDEAYGRSLRVTQPDGDELFINETMQDLYGYHRVGA